MTDEFRNDERPTVLVVDDDHTVNQMVQTALVRNGFKPITADNGEEGLELAQICKPAALILDWNMPLMNGLDVLKDLKSRDDTKDIPVIMLTGRRMSDDILTAIRAGASEYVVKPFEMTEFMLRFKKAVIQFGNCMVLEDVQAEKTD